jgi:hypothetical protein
MLWRRENLFPWQGIKQHFLGSPAHTLVTALTMLPQLLNLIYSLKIPRKYQIEITKWDENNV